MKGSKVLLPGVVACLLAACSSDSRNAAVDDIVTKYRYEDGPGYAVGIFHGDRAVYRKGFGIAEVQHRTPITTATRFHIASVSKHVTAFAIGMLAREGRLQLEDDVRAYLPWLPEFEHTIKVRDLIHHSSGLRDQWMLLNMSGQTFTDHLTREEIVALVRQQRSLNFEPGTDYAYSNTGYTLLAEIVAAVTGMSFREYTKTALFSPLDMQNSVFYDDISETLQGRAHSYDRDDPAAEWRHVRLNYETVGATSMFTSVDDMLNWIENFLQPAVGGTALVDEMMQPVTLEDGRTLNYGFGLRRQIIGGHEVWLHGGSDAAFRSTIAFVPDSDFGVVVLANTPTDRTMMLRELIDYYLNDGEAIAVNEFPVEQAPDPGTLEMLAGYYLTDNDRMIRFRAESGRLVYETVGGSPATVVFRDDDTFDLGFPGRYWAYFRVEAIEDGQVTRLSRGDPSSPLTTPVTYERFEPIEAIAGSVTEYAGRYYSEELDASYLLWATDGRLSGRFPLAMSEDEFLPILPDRFESGSRWMPAVQFRRDCEGRIDGFHVTRRRVNRLLFAKAGLQSAGKCADNVQ